MKLGVFSDIHSNLEALEASLGDMKEAGVTRYVCLGDIVGYAANPRECLETVHALPSLLWVQGNHDQATGFGIHYSNEMAAAGIAYSRSQLTKAQLSLLKGMSMVEMEGEGSTEFTATHTAPAVKTWPYVKGWREAGQALHWQKTPVCFIGHTHVPMVHWRAPGETHDSKPGQGLLQLKEGDRHLINVGSVGQSRDGDPRACYVVFDTEAGTVTWRRIGYDVARAAEKIRAAGLPDRIADRLLSGR